MKLYLTIVLWLMSWCVNAQEFISELQVNEKHGKWLVVTKDSLGGRALNKPAYVLYQEHDDARFELLCRTDNSQLTFKINYFDVKPLDESYILNNSIAILIGGHKTSVLGVLAQDNEYSLSWESYVYYSESDKKITADKENFVTGLTQFFKHIAMSGGSLLVEAKTKNNAVYRAKFSADGLAISFQHFAALCGRDFMQRFAIAPLFRERCPSSTDSYC